MARIATKLNWTSDADNAPLPSDFNRIENNNKQAFDEIDANEGDRAIDEAALQANIDAEETRATNAETSEASTRAAADTAKMTLDGIGSYAFLVSTGTVLPGGTVVANGTNLRYAGFNSQNLPPTSFSGIFASSPTPTGTWKCMGIASAAGGFGLGWSLFVKIS